MDKFDLTYELQKMAAESPDEVEVSVDENGDIVVPKFLTDERVRQLVDFQHRGGGLAVWANGAQQALAAMLH